MFTYNLVLTRAIPPLAPYDVGLQNGKQNGVFPKKNRIFLSR